MGFLKWLDGFLSDEIRRAPLEELGRARLVAGAAIVLVLLASLTFAAFLVAGLRWSYIVAISYSLSGYGGALWSLRKVSSPRGPAMILSVVMASGVMLTAFYERDPYLSTNAALMLITILTVYLLGPRLGLVILVPVILCVGVVCPLWLQAKGPGLHTLAPSHMWVMHVTAALCSLTGWAIGWLYSSSHAATHAVLDQDIKARKAAEAKLGELHNTLLDVSRHAGMSEIATGVLHNVGNTLNSVNVSASVVTDRLRSSRMPKLVQTAELLRDHAADLAAFLTTDSRGAKLPAYLMALSTQLATEREEMLAEMHLLGESIEHIKSIISMQQQHARLGGVVEEVPVPQLISDALRLNAGAIEQQGIEVRCEYADVPPIVVDRHKLLQILLNLMNNARHALVESRTPDKRLTIRVGLDEKEERLRIEVVDNGVGIAPENLPRIFGQGFTTKKTGHGFGLHISALTAAELKGRLTVASAGPNQGATFTVELPLLSEDSIPPMAPAN